MHGVKLNCNYYRLGFEKISNAHAPRELIYYYVG